MGSPSGTLLEPEAPSAGLREVDVPVGAVRALPREFHGHAVVGIVKFPPLARKTRSPMPRLDLLTAMDRGNRVDIRASTRKFSLVSATLAPFSYTMKSVPGPFSIGRSN